jgi:hypothetical protein
MLHRSYRRRVPGHLDRATDYVHATASELIPIVWIAPELRRSKIAGAASPVWKGMASDLFKETPQIEILNATITVDVVTCSALAQTD